MIVLKMLAMLQWFFSVLSTKQVRKLIITKRKGMKERKNRKIKDNWFKGETTREKSCFADIMYMMILLYDMAENSS